MKKNILKITAFLLVAAASLAVLFSSKASAEENVENNNVKSLFEEYYHDGVYTKDTLINLTETAQSELITHFHAQANALVRTTYYSGDALWMSRGAEDNGVKYSYYGTHYTDGVADGVTNATANTPLVTPENPSVVLKGEGRESMENYYTTLFDFINCDAEWVVDGNGYSTTDAKVLKYYLDFTAPCLYDTVLTNNYFSYAKATVEEVNNELVMKLWVTTENYGAINGGVENANNVLSQATIKSHHYSDWYVEKNPTIKEEGLKVKSCSCGDRITQVVAAGVNFTRDFNLDSANGNWKYGSIEYHWVGSETFDFTPLTDRTGDAWVAEGIEIKADWINVNKMMAVAYTVTEDVNADAFIKFVGGTEATRLSLRIGIKNSEGVLYSNPEFNGMETNVLELNKTYNFKAGDTIYFIFGNENWSEGAYPNGNLEINFTAAKEPADFSKDFNLLDANGTWKYGLINYHWGESETFDFVLFTDKTDEAWIGEGVEVKRDWINAPKMLAIAYEVPEDMTVNAYIKFVGGTEATRFSLRIGIKNSEGVLYGNPEFNGMETNVLELNKTYDFKAGDVIYFIFGNEVWADGVYTSGNLQIIIG